MSRLRALFAAPLVYDLGPSAMASYQYLNPSYLFCLRSLVGHDDPRKPTSPFPKFAGGNASQNTRRSRPSALVSEQRKCFRET